MTDSTIHNYNPKNHPKSSWADVIQVIPKETDVYRQELDNIIKNALSTYRNGKKISQILDIGAGEGKFTCVLLMQLMNLNLLELNATIDVIEPEEELRLKFMENINKIANGFIINFHNLNELPSEDSKLFSAINSIEQHYDLIIASHVTYYFPDGGINLAYRLVSKILREDGVAWFVIRNRRCSFYETKAEILRKNKIPDVNFHQYAESFLLAINCLFDKYTSHEISYTLNINKTSKDIIQYLSWLENLDDATISQFVNVKDHFKETHVLIPKKQSIFEKEKYVYVNEKELLNAAHTIVKCLNIIKEQANDIEFLSASLAEVKTTHSEKRDLNSTDDIYFSADSEYPVKYFEGFELKRYGFSHLTLQERDILDNYFREHTSFLYYPRFYIDHVISDSYKKPLSGFYSTSFAGKGKLRNVNRIEIEAGEPRKIELSKDVTQHTFRKALEDWNIAIKTYHLENIKSKKGEGNYLWSLSIGTHLLPDGLDKWHDDPILNSRCGLFLIIATKSKNLDDITSLVVGHIKNILTQYLAQGVYDVAVNKQIEAEKSAKMLSLLQAPLRRLTEAHRQIQEDTQELRAILYEPSEGIFAVQKEIAELFDEGDTILNPDKSRVILEHQPSKYIEEDDARWVLSHTLSRFRGGELRGIDAKDALDREICALKLSKSKPNEPLHEYAKSIERLLGINLDTMTSELISTIKPIEKLEDIKKILFTPFKPDRSNDNIRWSLLPPLLPSKVTIGTVTINTVPSPSSDQSSLIWVVSGANPFTIQGHLLKFVCRLIAQHLKNNSDSSVSVDFELSGCRMSSMSTTTIDSATNATVMFLSNEKDWIKKDSDESDGIDKLHALLNKEIINKQNGVVELGEHGDFHLPFVTLIRRFPPNDLNKINKEIVVKKLNGHGLSLEFREKLYIEFNGTKFTIKSSTQGGIQ